MCNVCKYIERDYFQKPKKNRSLRIWWIPQVPMNSPFYYPVKNVESAKHVLRMLADYDAFQFHHHVKNDYSNTGGLQIYDGREWIDWENETGDDIDTIMREEDENEE